MLLKAPSAPIILVLGDLGGLGVLSVRGERLAPITAPRRRPM